MIRLNLLDEKIDKSGIYFLQLLGFGCAVVLALGACFVIQDGLASDKELLEKEKQLLESRLARLKKITKEVEGLEGKKQLLKEKLMTIATLKANKNGPVQVLDDLNLSVPERAWLKQINDEKGTIRLAGVALDNQTVSDFMDSLEESKFFKDVDLRFSNQVIQDNVKLQSFSLTAKKISLLEIQREDKAKAKKEAKEKEAQDKEKG